jgi:hypothetical protein
MRGRSCEVRGEVRHVTTVVARDRARLLSGLAWEEPATVVDFLSMESLVPVQTTPREGPERRATPRFIAVADTVLEQPTWSTVELIDVSTIGVLFSCPTGPDLGERGELRVRLGDAPFAAQVEMRRSDERKVSHTHTAFRVGAAFVSLDETNRLRLEDFIGDARR